MACARRPWPAGNSPVPQDSLNLPDEKMNDYFQSVSRMSLQVKNVLSITCSILRVAFRLRSCLRMHI